MTLPSHLSTEKHRSDDQKQNTLSFTDQTFTQLKVKISEESKKSDHHHMDNESNTITCDNSHIDSRNDYIQNTKNTEQTTEKGLNNLEDKQNQYIQSKISLKFRHSVPSNWISSRRKKSNTEISNKKSPIYFSSAIIDQDISSNSQNMGNLKLEDQKPAHRGIAKRMSLTPSSLLPKRFSSSIQTPLGYEKNNQSPAPNKKTNVVKSTSEKELSKSPKVFSPPSSPLLPLSPNRSTTTCNTPLSSSLSSSIPYQQTLNHGTSFSSSTPSEKSTIGKSLTAFKRTTKTILFLESNSNNSNVQISSPYSSQFSDSENLEIDKDDFPLVRRAISYTDADRKQAISFANLDDPIESRSIREKNYTSDDKNKGFYNVGFKPLADSTNGITFFEESNNKETTKNNNNRQRAKTMDGSDNPLLELTNSNTGLLSSIANFVKINRSSSYSSVKINPSLPELPKIDNLETVQGETPNELLERLLKIYPLTLISEVLSQQDNELLKQTLHEYLRKYYDFTNLPLDMALREFLMLNYLPKETQQIDRVVHQFAKYYYESHPELGFDKDTVYILTYSLIMVHTDKFNPNNKRKMSRFEFIQNVRSAIENNLESSSESDELTNLICKELLGYFFDNITYCPLIKISQEQSDIALKALEGKNISFPYPNLSFLNGPNTSRTYDYDRKSSVSSSTASTQASLVSIHRSASQQLLPVQAPLRKKSSSFLWTSVSAMIDPYDYIVRGNSLSMDELRLLTSENDVNLMCRNPFIASDEENKTDEFLEKPSIEMIEKQLDDYADLMNREIDTKFLRKVWRSLTGDRIEFTLKVPKHKGSYLFSSNAETVPLSEGNGDEYYLIRVVKVGLIDKQESTKLSNSINSIPVPTPDSTDMTTMEEIDNNLMSQKNLPTNKNKNKNKIWKRYFCILTVVGMLFYEDVSLFKMRFCGINKFDGMKMVLIEEASSLGSSITDTLSPAQVNASIGSLNSENTGFTLFPYYRTEKADKSGKDSSMLPSFIIDRRSFATRKVQNIEYDETINDIDIQTSIQPPQTLPPNSESLPISQSLSISSGVIISSNKSQHKLSRQQDQYKASSSTGLTLSPTFEEEKLDSSKNTEKISSTGVVAQNIKKSTSRKYTFFIYSKNSKNIFMVSSKEELKSWIHSINITSVLSGVNMNQKNIDFTMIPKDLNGTKSNKIREDRYYEVVPKCNATIEQRFNGDDVDGSTPETIAAKQANITTEAENKELQSSIRRKRSNTTFLRKITPSIPSLGLGLNIPTGLELLEKEQEDESYVLDFENDIHSKISHYSNSTGKTTKLDLDSVKESNNTNNNQELEDLNGETQKLESPFKSHNLDITSLENEYDVSINQTELFPSSSHGMKSLHADLLEHLYSVKQLKLVMPLQKKTKEDLLSTAKILGVKLEWLWYNKCKSKIIMMISKRIMEMQADMKEGIGL